MEAKGKAGEEDLSMEEILHSIRKIIADDGDDAGAGSTNGTGAVTGSDVLELTDIIAEEPAAAPAAAAPVNNDVLSAIDDVFAAAPVAAPAPAPKPAPAPTPAPQAAPISPDNQAFIDSLLSKESANAASSAFNKALPADAPIITTPSPTFRSGGSVEDLVMEALKPMLKSWLDANLPNIVERIVEREVRKLSQ
jgi:cell pole-organizing protein PopZ